MNEFSKLQQAYRSQPAPPANFNSLMDRLQVSRQKSWLTILIISMTLIAFILFAILIDTGSHWHVRIIFLLMGVSLTGRIAWELWNVRKLKKLDRSLSPSDYQKQVYDFAGNRRWTHFLVTPVTYGIWIAGFVMLLPYFEQVLSRGFYLYVKYSSVVIFAALGILFWVQARRDLQRLKSF